MPTIQIADKPTLDTVKTNTDSTNTKLGNTADANGTTSSGSAMGKLNKILGGTFPGVVKQVAFGSHTFTSISNATITTGVTVDTSKTIVLIQNERLATSSANSFGSRLVSMTSTTITVSANYWSPSTFGTITWQLIEFR